MEMTEWSKFSLKTHSKLSRKRANDLASGVSRQIHHVHMQQNQAGTMKATNLWIYFFFITSSAILSCGADKNREKVHVAKRQELKNRQRDAMLAGKPVQTVIEEVEPLMQRSTSRISCVRELPDFQALDKLRPKQAISLEKIEPPNFNTMTMESNQSKVMIELSELHDIAGSSSNSTPAMKCHGLNDDTTTAIPLDEDEFHDISLSD